MTDEEYIQFLESIGNEYLRLDAIHKIFHPMKSEPLSHLNRMLKAARTARFSEEHWNREEVYRLLKSDIDSYQMDIVYDLLEKTGVLDALDDYGDIIFPNLTREVIPDEDLKILSEAGERNPDALIQLAIARAKVFTQSKENYNSKKSIASSILKDAGIEIKDACNDIGKLSDKFNKKVVIEETCPDWEERQKKLKQLDDEISLKPKKRKWFGGIARIIAGGASATSNVLLGVGLISTGGGAPVGTAAIIGSCTASLVLIGDGIDKVRGAD